MCAADSTIEPPWRIYDAAGDVLDAGINGEGFTHECRDNSLLWEMVINSEAQPLKPWNWHDGDTVEGTVF